MWVWSRNIKLPFRAATAALGIKAAIRPMTCCTPYLPSRNPTIQAATFVGNTCGMQNATFRKYRCFTSEPQTEPTKNVHNEALSNDDDEPFTTHMTDLLIEAATNCETDEVRELLLQGADPNAMSYYAEAPLHCATTRGLTDMVELLLQHGADPNTPTEDCESLTPLHIASKKGYGAIVRLLLQYKADPNFSNDYCYQFWTPLHLACKKGNAAIVKMLLEHGADTTVKAKGGSTPLDVAIREKQHNAVKVLRGTEATPRQDAPRKNGWTPLHAAARHGIDEAITNLLDNDADPNSVDANGRTPLFGACQNGYHCIVQQLLEHGADPTIADKEGRTPLYETRAAGSQPIITLLKNAIDKKNQGIFPPIKIPDTERFMTAAKEGNTIEFRNLLLKGTDPNIRDVAGWSLLHHASSNGRTDVVKMLLQQRTDPNVVTNNDDKLTPLHLASQSGHEAVVALLLKHNADPNFANKTISKLWSPLHAACEIGNAGVVKLLLEHGADSTIRLYNGLLPYDVAVKHNHTTVVALLDGLQRPSTIRDIANKDGWTPLHAACKTGPESVVTMFLQRGADVKLADKNGSTSLHFACRRGNTAIVKLLLEFGADPSVADHCGNTPLHEACESESIVKLLLAAIK